MEPPGSPAPPPGPLARTGRCAAGNDEHRSHESPTDSRERPEHRDHGPHRRGQDHDDRADPLLHRPHPQDGRGPRRRCRHGLDGAGAGARDHDHVGCDDGDLARLSHQHYRYARARGLYGRSGAKPARARRRDRRLRLCRRRRAAIRDGLAPGRPLQGSPDRVHEQDGPHGRGLLRLREDDGRPPRRAARPRPAAHRERGALPRRRRPRRDEGDHVVGRPRDCDGRRRDPGRALRAGERVSPPADRRGRRPRRRAAGDLPRGRERSHARDAQARPPRRDARHHGHPGPPRLGVQEQGRPAAPRRGHRLPAEPARRPADPRHRPAHRARVVAAPRPR